MTEDQAIERAKIRSTENPDTTIYVISIENSEENERRFTTCLEIFLDTDNFEAFNGRIEGIYFNGEQVG